MPSRRGSRIGPYDGWRPRLVATDLDGTLLRSDATLSDRNRATIHRLREQGVPVVPVTGRGPRLLHQTRAELAEHGLIVLAQGGCVYDGDDLLFAASLSVDRAEQLLDLMRQVRPDVLIGAETLHEVALRLQHGFQWPYAIDEYVHVDEQQVVTTDVLKVFVSSPELSADELLLIAQQVIPPDLASATHSGLNAVEISPPGISKASGLALAAQRLGIEAADTIAFGDMPNDLPMFAWAGWSVAMANAHPLVLSSADDVAESNDEDGLSLYLERIFDW